MIHFLKFLLPFIYCVYVMCMCICGYMLMPQCMNGDQRKTFTRITQVSPSTMWVQPGTQATGPAASTFTHWAMSFSKWSHCLNWYSTDRPSNNFCFIYIFAFTPQPQFPLPPLFSVLLPPTPPTYTPPPLFLFRCRGYPMDISQPQYIKLQWD